MLDVDQKYLVGISKKNPSQHQPKNLANVVKKITLADVSQKILVDVSKKFDVG